MTVKERLLNQEGECVAYVVDDVAPGMAAYVRRGGDGELVWDSPAKMLTRDPKTNRRVEVAVPQNLQQRCIDAVRKAVDDNTVLPHETRVQRPPTTPQQAPPNARPVSRSVGRSGGSLSTGVSVETRPAE